MEERIFFVRNGNLNHINDILKKGGSIKMIHAVPQVVSTSYDEKPLNRSSFFNTESQDDPNETNLFGDVCAYIVVKMP